MNVTNFDLNREFAGMNVAEREPEQIPINMVKAKHFAYHVTNVKASDPEPTFTELRLSIAYDNYYDTVLVGLPCVFVSTTVMGPCPPKGSYYPTSCKDKTIRFHRLRIPFEAFDPYDRIWLASAKGEQRHIVLTKGVESNFIEGHPGIEELRWENNPFFCRVQNNDGSYQYYVHKYYGDEETEYFVNIVLLHNFEISHDMDYKPVDHWIPTNKNQQRANDLERARRNFAELYELKEEDFDPTFYARQMQNAQDAWFFKWIDNSFLNTFNLMVNEDWVSA